MDRSVSAHGLSRLFWYGLSWFCLVQTCLAPSGPFYAGPVCFFLGYRLALSGLDMAGPTVTGLDIAGPF
jgi:hypothetical protein